MWFLSPILLLYLLCASGFTLAKGALGVTTPFFFAGVRLFVAGLILLLWFLQQNHWRMPSRASLRSWGLIVQLALLGTYGMFVCDLWSLQFFSSTESAFIFTFTPFVTALLSWWWFAEKLTRRKFLGIGLGMIAGILFVGAIPSFSIQTLLTLPFLVLSAAVILGAYGWILVRELVQRENLPIAWVQGISMTIAGILALGTSYLSEYALWNPVPVSKYLPFIGYTGAALVFVNIGFTNLYSYLLRFFTATLLSFAGFLCPMFVALLGVLFLEETIPVASFFALALFSLGLFIFYSEELHQGYYSV